MRGFKQGVAGRIGSMGGSYKEGRGGGKKRRVLFLPPNDGFGR